MLLVTEEAVVVDELEGVPTLAMTAEVWFYYLASVDELIVFVVALEALERCFFHFRNDVAASDHDTLDGDELINVSGVKTSHLVSLSQIKWPNLNDGVFSIILLEV